MPSDEAQISSLEAFGLSLACGGGAGAFAKTCVAPLDRIKTTLQAQSMSTQLLPSQRYTGLLDALVRMPREQGVLSMWRGNGANCLRIIPNAAIKFSAYDRIKESVLPASGDSVPRRIAAAMMSGALTQAATYPLDLARTRLAVDMARKGEKRLYRGMIDCLVTTARVEGPRALYQGCHVSIWSYSVYLGIQFPLYDRFKGLLREDGGQSSVPTAALAGGSAGVIAKTATFPMDTVIRRLMVAGGRGQSTRFAGVLACMRDIWHEGGVRAFYRGVAVCVMRAVPGAALQFVAYDTLKNIAGVER